MSSVTEIRQVVIWGHKLHSHTHSYIHNGFYIAFKHLGYKTSWYDDKDDVSGIDFTQSLFITEHQVNKKIPLRNDCMYLTHYVDPGDYAGVPKENIVILKVSQRDFVECDQGKNYIHLPLYYGVPNEFYAECNEYSCFYTYWATDLLPHEIDKNIEKLPSIVTENKINFVGSMTRVWHMLQQLCRGNNIEFNNYGASFNVNSPTNKTIEENIDLIQRSLISPALQDDAQVNSKYVPCRIFKNISYGKMGLTNNEFVHKLFNRKTIYNRDIGLLCNQGIYFEKNTDPTVKIEKIKELMLFVRDNHTYLNRINSISRFIEEFTFFLLPLPTAPSIA